MLSAPPFVGEAAGERAVNLRKLFEEWVAIMIHRVWDPSTNDLDEDQQWDREVPLLSKAAGYEESKGNQEETDLNWPVRSIQLKDEVIKCQ